MGVTTIFGIIGFGIVFQKYEVPVATSKILMSLLVLAVLMILGLVFKKQQLVFKGLSISKVMQTFRGLSISIKGKAICYSIIRYLIFSTLFFSILHFFKAEISLLEFIPLVFSMYLVTSMVPTILFFDVVVKGGAAVWLFSLAGISEIPVLSTVLGMWILNFVIPSIIGGFYMFTYTPQKA